MSISLKIEKRPSENRWRSLLLLVCSIIGGLAAASLLFLAKGINPLMALQKIFLGSFGSWYGFKETITKAIPLILIGTGLSISFQGKFWNIGAEGQLLAGAIGATGVGLFAAPSNPILTVSLMFTVGFLCGAAWGLLPALMRVKWGISETISSLMLNYIIAEFVQYLVYGPWKGKTQFGFPYTDDLPAQALLPTFAKSRIPIPTLVIAIFSAIALYVLLKKTTFGYEIRVMGENPQAAHYAGMGYGKIVMIMMIISGGLAGIAGVGEIAGIHRHLTYPWSISSGYGFTAIITAYLARLNPLWVIASSVFFGGILVGGDVIQTSLGLPFATVHIFNGTLLFALLIGDFFRDHHIHLKRT